MAKRRSSRDAKQRQDTVRGIQTRTKAPTSPYNGITPSQWADKD